MNPLPFVEGDRVLVTGSTGWFGATALSLIPREVLVLKTASVGRFDALPFALARVREFAPTHVLNFAFLTREKVELMGLAQYECVNRSLIDDFIQASSLPSVRGVLTISSGAVVTEPASPYGILKALEEQAALSLVSEDRAVCVIRAFSVSGPYVRRPSDYAFSNLILQAMSGSIEVLASHPTYRRYVAVDDVLRLALMEMRGRSSSVIETGGPLVEMLELAGLIADVLNPGIPVNRVNLVSDEISIYASDGASWDNACDRNGLIPLTLREQIVATAEGLVGGKHE